MNQLSLHYVNHADREREIVEDLRNRQILDNGNGPTAAERSTRTTGPRVSAADARAIPIRARAAGR